jgi:enoyl-CoA hydratase/carnithine racemase
VLPGTGGTQRLARLVGKSRAIELMAMGRTFSFEQALEWGIISDIFEGDAASFRDQILTYAKQFTTPNKAPMAVGHIKRSVQTGMELPLNDALALERELQSLLFKSEDAKEGIAAYNEKRMARFKNK